MKNILLLKLKDGFISILPIYLIIIILNFTPLLNISSYEIGVLSFATILAGIGIALFNMGSDLAMTPMGKLSGANLTKQGKLITLLIFVFVLGFFVTLAEPNLSILGQQIANLLNPLIIIVAVAFGVGLALVLLVIRSIHKIDLSKILLFLYGLAFALTTLVIYTGSSDFLGFIFDAGGVTTGPVTVPFMMAICFNGLNEDESFYLTKAMTLNGETIKFEGIDNTIVDKHSTGGVGDKVSLILVPLLASLDINVAKMSGKGLGFTGGTIDKLHSIGIKTELKDNEYIELLKKEHMFFISQSDKIAPADKILYSIRDTSGTIDNISLIAASIMSKKIATNADVIYLDVKVGDGAFFKTLKEAKKFS